MNIGLDVTSLIYQRGVSRYTANLVRALSRYTQHQLHLYGSSLRRYQFLKKSSQDLLETKQNTRKNKQSALGQDNIKIQPLPISVLQKLWRLGLNPVSRRFSDLDVFHSWDWLQPPDKNLPLVSTIHDLAILKYPEAAHPKIVAAHRRSWQILKQRRAHIIAVSQATKKDVVNFLGFPNWQVHVVPEALPTEIIAASNQLQEEKVELIKQKLKLERPFIFFVGVREPRKNLPRLIQAWQPLADEVDLIVAGDKSWQQLDLEERPELRFLGHVSDQELCVLYAEAEMLAYPSLYEGFGLPILEAFHHGTPVVTANISAMIEVAGNAAELVDPFSVADIRRAIKKILNEDTAAQQQRLQRMIIRKQMFSWQKVAKQTIKVYQQALADFADQ